MSHCVDVLTGKPLADFTRDKRVLYHFMTGGCVNCLHLLSELRRLRLPDDTTLVTVHSGKFPKECEESFVRDFARIHGIDSPIVNDADGALRDAFALKAWPTMVLADEKGYEIGRAVGEGSAEKLVETAASKKKRCTTKGFLFDKVATDGETLWLSDRDGGAVVRCDLQGRMLEKYEGFAEPRGLVVVRDFLYVADREAGEIVAMDRRTGERRTIASNLRSPWGLSTDGRALQVAEAGSHRILNVGFDGCVEVLAGLGYEGVREGDARTEALFAQPTDLDWLGDALYVADAEGSALRVVEYGRVETPIGWDLFTFGDADGIGEAVRLQHPEGLCAGVGGCGNYRIFIADTYNDKLKVFDPLTARVTTLAEGLMHPTGVTKLGCALYITDAIGLVRYDLSDMTHERMTLA